MFTEGSPLIYNVLIPIKCYRGSEEEPFWMDTEPGFHFSKLASAV